MFLLGLIFLLVGLQQPSVGDADSLSPVKDVEGMAYPMSSDHHLVGTDVRWNQTDQRPDLQDGSDSLTYTATKAKISLLKVRLRHELGENRIDIDSVKRIFTDQLTNHIIPYWYGTGWSFGGHTSVPKKGKIACGYFISTTLKDMGLKVNRYKLAQKSPLDEAKAISCGAKITTIAHEDPEQALTEIRRLVKEGVYFIGFDTGHVGFLVKNKDGISLIHSNYLFPVSVCIEPLEASKIFRTFNKFHLVNISYNEKLIRKWLNGERIL